MEERDLSQLASSNQAIFEKCRNALLHNGVSQEQISSALAAIKLFDMER